MWMKLRYPVRWKAEGNYNKKETEARFGTVRGMLLFFCFGQEGLEVCSIQNGCR